MSQQQPEQQPNCFTCQFIQATPGGWFCLSHHFLIDDPRIKDSMGDASFTDFCEDYQEADSDEHH